MGCGCCFEEMKGKNSFFLGEFFKSIKKADEKFEQIKKNIMMPVMEYSQIYQNLFLFDQALKSAEFYKAKLEEVKLDEEYLQEVSNELSPRRKMHTFLIQSVETLEKQSFFKNYTGQHAALLMTVQECVNRFDPDKVNVLVERNPDNVHEIMEKRGILLESQINATIKGQPAQKLGQNIFLTVMNMLKQRVKR